MKDEIPMSSRRPYAWEKSYPAGMRWDSPIATSTLPELLDRAVADYGDRPALEYHDRRISYRGLGEEAARAAAAFRHIGIDRGHAVALYMPNTPWHPIAFFGVLRTGAHIVHLSPLDAERELIQKLADSGARTVMTVNLSGLDAKALKLAAGGHVDRVIVADDAVWRQSPPSPPVNRVSASGHPPLQGEGRTAAGSPGWGGSGATDDSDSAYAATL
jgi:long-chain acyl-CoA synthetase